jgi:DNA mismatch repair protein MutH
MSAMIQPPPTTLLELSLRSEKLAGVWINDLARQQNQSIPSNLQKQKGWLGQLIERHLGADSSNRPQPDFSKIGVELKTLPINTQGKVLESTYISHVNLKQNALSSWETSNTKKKLTHILWVPIAREKELIHARIAAPFFWSPNTFEEQQLKHDWEHIMELITLGNVEQLNARLGDILQVRPKAAHAKILTETINSNGKRSRTLPRGFYLRAHFTQQLLHRYLKI